MAAVEMVLNARAGVAGSGSGSRAPAVVRVGQGSAADVSATKHIIIIISC